MDILTSRITSKKVCGNNVDFSTIEIMPKKYVETTWFFDHQNYIKKVRGNEVEIRQIFALLRIEVIPMWNRRRFHMVCQLGIVFLFCILTRVIIFTYSKVAISIYLT